MCRRRIFLCDDDPDYRALVRAVLEPEGATIVGEASSGAECAERAPATRPDLILLDHKMPGASGLEVLPLIREAAPDADVVFLSTAWREQVEPGMLERGARAFLPKPERIVDLPPLLRQVLV